MLMMHLSLINLEIMIGLQMNGNQFLDWIEMKVNTLESNYLDSNLLEIKFLFYQKIKIFTNKLLKSFNNEAKQWNKEKKLIGELLKL